MSDLNTIKVEKNRQREQEAARRKAIYEQHKREVIKKRKQKQVMKYVTSFSLMIAAIVLCCAYLLGVFEPDIEPATKPADNTVSGNEKPTGENPTEEDTTPTYVEVPSFNPDKYVFTENMYKFEIEDDILERLQKAANTESDSQDVYKFLLENKAAYPQGLLYLATNEPQALEFVIEYPFKSKEASYYFDLSKEISERRVPHFLQWDDRWGYSAFGDDNMALDGCGPTCLSMVLVGLTGDQSYNPMYIANYSEQRGYYLYGVGTKWEFFTKGVEFFNLESTQIANDKERMISELEKGNILICSMAPGDFTLSGHFIVVWDYKDGEFVVNDPNSIIRTEKTWSYEVLKSQMKAIWTFSMAE